MINAICSYVEKPLYVSQITKKVDVTYSHAWAIINTLEDHKLVKVHVDGRVKRIMPTPKLDKINIKLIEIKQIVEGTK